MRGPIDPCRRTSCRAVGDALGRACAVVLLTVLGQTAPAATFPDLYAIIVPQDGAGTTAQGRTQDEVVRFAMGQLLTRVTGRRDAAFEPALGGMLQSAGEYVEQIGPLDRDNLIVRFNARSIEASLIRLEQPVWGSERPQTLVWIAIDAGLGRRELMPAEPQLTTPSAELGELLANVRNELASVASERGLVLTLPLLDIDDMSTLTFADVWGGFADRIERASARYGADDILIGQIRVAGFGPVARWTLLRGGREIALPGQSVTEGLDALADLYAAEFSTIGRASATAVTVLGVHTLEDYGRVMRYMESLSVLDSVVPDQLGDGTLRLRVAARGGDFALRRVLGLGQILTPVAGDGGLTFTLGP